MKERSFITNLKWTKEKVLLDAKKYERKSDWQKNSPNAYSAANRNLWNKDATAHMKERFYKLKWTKEKVLLDAKKYKRKSDWNKNSPGAYRAAKRYGWFEKAISHIE